MSEQQSKNPAQILVERILFLRARYLIFAGASLGFITIVVEELTKAPRGLPLRTFVSFGKFGAATLLSVAIVRIFLDIQETKQYFKNIFHELLVENVANEDFITSCPDNKLRKAHALIIKKQARIRFPEDGTFYKEALWEKIHPLLGKVHYDKATFIIVNTFKKNRNRWYIESKKTTEFLYHSRTSQEFNLGFNYLILSPIPGFALEELYSINEFVVAGDIITDEVNLRLKKEKLEDGSIKFELSYPHQLIVPDNSEEGTKVYVRRIERLFLPVGDSHRWTIPEGMSLRELNLTCNFHRDKPVFPKLYLFGIQTNQAQPIEQDYQCNISGWKGWMLPKHGFIINWCR